MPEGVAGITQSDSDSRPANWLLYYFLGIGLAFLLGVLPLLKRVPGFRELYRILPLDYRVSTLLVSSLAMALASLAALVLTGKDNRISALNYRVRFLFGTIIAGILCFAALKASFVTQIHLEGASWSEPVVVLSQRLEGCPCGTEEDQEDYLHDKACIKDVLTLNPDNLDICWNGRSRRTVLLGLSLSYVVATAGLGACVGVLFGVLLNRKILTERECPPVELKVFISYRRADYRQTAERIYDHLAERYGEDHVFKDVDDILIGSDFQEEIFKYLQSCDFVLAIIGPRWLDIEDEKGHRRLDQEGDFVRIEIEEALKREDLRLVPVLVGGAVMPNKDRLPPSLQGLARINALAIRDDPDFKVDIKRLMRALEKVKSVSNLPGEKSRESHSA